VPTVTDALLVLGILSADADFAGGSFSLRPEGVAEAFQRIGAELGYGAEAAAFDCWRVVNANMSQAVRRVTAGKGIDPADMIMLAYGGNGPAFAAIQAEELGIGKVLVPKASPAFSALGTLAARPSIDEERSYSAPANNLDPHRLASLWNELDQRAGKYFADAGFLPDAVSARYQMNMRYPGQNWSLTFDISTRAGLQDLSFIDADIGPRAIAAFNARHMDEFGHVREGESPEITGVRLVTSVETASPRVTRGFSAQTVIVKAKRTRRANLGAGFADTAIFRGSDLKAGHQVAGPAIIEETFTTIVVYPGWKAQVDDAGDYELTRT
jgi:N-methylhydantoinase A